FKLSMSPLIAILIEKLFEGADELGPAVNVKMMGIVDDDDLGRGQELLEAVHAEFERVVGTNDGLDRNADVLDLLFGDASIRAAGAANHGGEGLGIVDGEELLVVGLDGLGRRLRLILGSQADGQGANAVFVERVGQVVE